MAAMSVGTTKEAARGCTLSASCRSVPRSSRSLYLTTSQVHLSKGGNASSRGPSSTPLWLACNSCRCSWPGSPWTCWRRRCSGHHLCQMQNFFTLLVADFFKWRPSEPFDVFRLYVLLCT